MKSQTEVTEPRELMEPVELREVMDEEVRDIYVEREVA